jgi:hypothetical protein
MQISDDVTLIPSKFPFEQFLLRGREETFASHCIPLMEEKALREWHEKVYLRYKYSAESSRPPARADDSHTNNAANPSDSKRKL